MKIYKSILISFVSAVMTVSFAYGGYSIYASNDVKDYYTFKKPNASFFLVQALYHKAMNEYFNDKLSALTDLMSDENFYNNSNFKAPDGVDSSNYKDKCGQINLSSYCVSMGALDLYMAYVETLNQMKGYLFDGGIAGSVDKETLLNTYSAKTNKIDKEVVEAKTVMQSTIAAYDEFKMAYPMHQKYKTIINNLMKYKIALSKIRKQVYKFPSKFIDATSSECK